MADDVMPRGKRAIFFLGIVSFAVVVLSVVSIIAPGQLLTGWFDDGPGAEAVGPGETVFMISDARCDAQTKEYFITVYNVHPSAGIDTEEDLTVTVDGHVASSLGWDDSVIPPGGAGVARIDAEAQPGVEYEIEVVFRGQFSERLGIAC